MHKFAIYVIVVFHEFDFVVWIVGGINKSGAESEHTIVQSATKDPLSRSSHSTSG